MQKEQSQALGLLAGAGTILVIAGVIGHVKVVRTERKKRERIKEWHTNALAATKASKERMQRMAVDPSVTLNEYLAAWIEEQKFMNLIHNQPMY